MIYSSLVQSVYFSVIFLYCDATRNVNKLWFDKICACVFLKKQQPWMPWREHHLYGQLAEFQSVDLWCVGVDLCGQTFSTSVSSNQMLFADKRCTGTVLTVLIPYKHKTKEQSWRCCPVGIVISNTSWLVIVIVCTWQSNHCARESTTVLRTLHEAVYLFSDTALKTLVHK